jgi:PIN domain nuclease of toxin-antitoxin system
MANDPTGRVVLDSSALLAVLNREPGAELVAELLGNTAVCAVNLAEVQAKLVGRGIDREAAATAILGLISDVVAFDESLAILTGSLITGTQKLGLSLGDRACVALGIQTKAPVYTADRAWAKLDVGIEIRLIR